jgi:ribose transport system ATP-binding protein
VNSSEPFLQVRCLHKAFPGVQALSGVDFDIYPGEVHALVGENGAGKSTLIKILSGAYAPDEGSIHLNGQSFRMLTPRLAQSLGIRTIYQERSLIPWMSVAENILVGDLPGRSFLVNWKKVEQKTRIILDQLELSLDSKEIVNNLGIAKQQGVEIAKALYQRAKVVIMDEPTASLGRPEVEHLFSIVHALRKEGIGIIYISHHLEEIFAIANRITVLRDGKVVGKRQIKETNPHDLMNMMVGRDLSGIQTRELTSTGEIVLLVENLSRKPSVNNVSLDIRAGEVVGIAGMVGSGRTELARMIFGIDKPDQGRVIINGFQIRQGGPQSAIEHGIALVPEDRKTQGLVACLDIVDNINMASTPRGRALISNSRLEKTARSHSAALDIRASALHGEVQYLSGGNQQKVVLAKWLEVGADLFIFDEPTRGVDVGAKLEIHRLILKLANSGKAILMISSDLPELLALSDRILVMRKGQIVGEFTADQADEHKIIEVALGEANGKNGR